MRGFQKDSKKTGFAFVSLAALGLTHYARLGGRVEAASLWTPGTPLTEIVHDVGFFDLAHLDHAFMETFGVNPSLVIDPPQVTLIRCPRVSPSRNEPGRSRRWDQPFR